MSDHHIAATSSTFERMLADPHEQFDLRSELLASIVAYAAAPPSAAGNHAAQAVATQASHYAWLYAPAATTGNTAA